VHCPYAKRLNPCLGRLYRSIPGTLYGVSISENKQLRAMKVSIINQTDILGGAARAAYRLHHALRRDGLDSTMMVTRAFSDDWTVQGTTGTIRNLVNKTRPYFGIALNALQKTENPAHSSPAFLSSTWPRRINESDCDIVNLNWVGSEVMSIEDIGLIRKPIVWTLHDMWAFCGAEHFSINERWRDGYLRKNRPLQDSWFDLNRWVWNRKRKVWRNPIHIVAVSHWLADCARKSKLMKNWPISVIPNTLDTKIWKPEDKIFARSLFGLPHDKPIVLFGALGNNQHHKGFDLLKESLQNMHSKIPDLNLVVFGQMEPRYPHDFGFKTVYAGTLNDDLSLRLLYSAVDLMLVPSRMEAFGQTASEAHACGTPVVAYNTCGLPDIVVHEETGYLAKPFDTKDFADGILWALADEKNLEKLGERARKRAVEQFDYSVVVKQYKSLYEQVILENKTCSDERI
jgi:glycosyltransferase involved in cell wall biosynthesis